MRVVVLSSGYGIDSTPITIAAIRFILATACDRIITAVAETRGSRATEDHIFYAAADRIKSLLDAAGNIGSDRILVSSGYGIHTRIISTNGAINRILKSSADRIDVFETCI